MTIIRNKKAGVPSGIGKKRRREQSNILIAYFTGADNMPQKGLDAISSVSVKEVNGELAGNTELVVMRIQEYVQGDLLDKPFVFSELHLVCHSGMVDGCTHCDRKLAPGG